MAKIDTQKKPIVVRVRSEQRAREVADRCEAHGWKSIVGFEPDTPEDISDLEKALNPPDPVRSERIGRNELCPCGSGKKYKKCFGLNTK